MGYFYFDESIHDRHGFILGAFVHTDVDLDLPVERVLTAHGLVPGRDEYRSSTRAAGNPQQLALRKSMRGLITDCKVGAVVVPTERRADLGEEALRSLRKIIEANGLSGSHFAAFDQGVFRSVDVATKSLKQSGLFGRIDPLFEANSKSCKGLQLADLVAHTSGRMLVESLSPSPKVVKAGENSGYDPDLEIHLEFELWAGLRYQWFCGEDMDRPVDKEPIDWPIVDVSKYGLHISDHCSAELRAAALGRSAKAYLGCIH